jgi:hypothetical protein
MKFRALLLVATTSLFAACAHKPETASSSFDGAPSWASGEVPLGCGLGQTTVRGNAQGMARKTAQDSGRLEIAGTMKTQMMGMVKQYADAGELDGKEYNEEKVTTVSKSLVDQLVAGAHVKKTALVGKQFYALMCLDLEAFKGMVENMNTLSSKLRAGLKARADAEHAELERSLKEAREAEGR